MSYSLPNKHLFLRAIKFKESWLAYVHPANWWKLLRKKSNIAVNNQPKSMLL
jgi:hypothetical protein